MNIIVLVLTIIFAVIILFVVIGIIIRAMKGKIDIIPERYQYSPGETINGKVALNLKKLVQANSLNIGLVGEMQNKRYSGSSTRTNTSNIFSFSQPLEGKKDYVPSKYSYDFSIKIPSNILTKPKGAIGAILGTVEFISGQSSNIRWYLVSTLSCKGINLSKRVQINIA